MRSAPRLPFPVLALLGLTLLVRALVPTGWMPAHAASGIAIELCSGCMPAPGDPQMQAAQALLDTALAGTPYAGDRDSAAKDQPCVFTGLTSADNVATSPALALPQPAPAALAQPPQSVTIGHGLPAPPPPSTGPPTLS